MGIKADGYNAQYRFRVKIVAFGDRCEAFRSKGAFGIDHEHLSVRTALIWRELRCDRQGV